MKKLLIIAVAILSGCASNSGVIATGGDTYMVSRQAATGIGGLGNLKAEAYGEAGQFCGAKGLVPQVTQETESKPPFVFGNYPRAEIQFRCIARDSQPSLSSFDKK